MLVQRKLSGDLFGQRIGMSVFLAIQVLIHVRDPRFPGGFCRCFWWMVWDRYGWWFWYKSLNGELETWSRCFRMMRPFQHTFPHCQALWFSFLILGLKHIEKDYYSGWRFVCLFVTMFGMISSSDVKWLVKTTQGMRPWFVWKRGTLNSNRLYIYRYMHIVSY
jgi:hypothetical protein